MPVVHKGWVYTPPEREPAPAGKGLSGIPIDGRHITGNENWVLKPKQKAIKTLRETTKELPEHGGLDNRRENRIGF